jgi:putative hydrolase of the HAD superfamily
VAIPDPARSPLMRVAQRRRRRPKVIFFDAAGTLFHLPRGVGFHYRDVLARHGIHREEVALSAAFRAIWNELPPPANTEHARPDDDKGWWRELVQRVLDRCAVGEHELNRGPFFEELYLEFVRPKVWTLYPEVREVLASLERASIPLGLITNFDGRYRQIAEQLELARFFRHVVISSEVGSNKPAPRIFQHALEMAGVAPGDALHVGDDPIADWQGAAEAGLQVFRLERPRNSLCDLLSEL